MPKKVRVWFRQNRARWYAEYWEFGTRHCKAFRNKAEAQQWARFVERKFDAEEWHGIHGIDWPAAVEQFLQHKQVRAAPCTVTELRNSLQQFETLVGPMQTDLITTAHIEQFIERRRATYIKGRGLRTVAPRTVNKDLANLRTFLHWCQQNRLARTDLRFEMLPLTRRRFVPPSATAFAELFRLAREQSPSLHAFHAATSNLLASLVSAPKSPASSTTLSMRCRSRADLENIAVPLSFWPPLPLQPPLPSRRIPTTSTFLPRRDIPSSS